EHGRGRGAITCLIGGLRGDLTQSARAPPGTGRDGDDGNLGLCTVSARVRSRASVYLANDRMTWTAARGVPAPATRALVRPASSDLPELDKSPGGLAMAAEVIPGCSVVPAPRRLVNQGCREGRVYRSREGHGLDSFIKFKACVLDPASIMLQQFR